MIMGKKLCSEIFHQEIGILHFVYVYTTLVQPSNICNLWKRYYQLLTKIINEKRSSCYVCLMTYFELAQHNVQVVA